MKRLALIAALLLVAAPAVAKRGWMHWGMDINDDLPTCDAGIKGKSFWVVDGATATDCTTGNGVTVVICVCDGSSYIGSAPSGADGVGYDEVLDEGSGLTKRLQLNMIGAGVSCVDNAGSTRTDCTFTGGGAETNSLETTITGIADTELVIGTGADSGNYAAMSGDATLANTGALSLADDVVAAAEMADADHGDVAWAAGVATVENVQCSGSCVSDAEVDDDITASSYLPLAGGTVTGELVLDDALRLTPQATPPVVCAAGTLGTLYYDSSTDELCVCTAGPAWVGLVAGGACA